MTELVSGTEGKLPVCPACGHWVPSPARFRECNCCSVELGAAVGRDMAVDRDKAGSSCCSFNDHTNAVAVAITHFDAHICRKTQRVGIPELTTA